MMKDFLNEVIAALNNEGFKANILPSNSIDVEIDAKNNIFGRVHTEDLYEEYEQDPGAVIAAIIAKVKISAKEISPEIAESVKKTLDTNSKTDFMESLIIRAVNFKKHKASLKNAVYRMIDDEIAVVLYQQIPNDKSFMTHVVTTDQLHDLGVTMSNDYLLMVARQNTESKYPAKIVASGFSQEVELAKYDGQLKTHHVLLSCDSSNPNGATTLFYPATTRQLAKVMGGGFAAICMNTMDVMIVPSDDSSSIREFCTVASTDNEFGEMLSPKAYFFNEDGRPIAD